MYHYRKTRKTYDGHNAADKKDRSKCPFPSCNDASSQATIVENDTMYVVANRVAYDVFEGRRVEDHLMVIPKRHIETLADFTDQERVDQMKIMGEYEANGYNVYARGVGSVSRSVGHQHTHLIKIGDKKSNFVVHSRKPYFLLDI